MYNSFESISVRARLKRPDVLKVDWNAPLEPMTYDQMKGEGYFGTMEESLKSFEKLESKQGKIDGRGGRKI